MAPIYKPAPFITEFLLAIFFAIGIFFLLLTSCAHAIPLQEILHAAREHHPRLQQQKYALLGQKEGIAQARAAYRPTVNLQASFQSSRREATLRDGSLFDDTTKPRSVSVEATQTLYTGGRRALALRRALFAYKAIGEDLREIEINLYASLMQSYLQGLTLQKNIEARKESIIALDALLTGQQSRFHSGEGTLIEIAQKSARLAEAKALLASDEQALNQKKSEFFNDTGLHIEFFVTIANPVTSYLDLERLLKQVSAVNPSIKAAHLRMQAAQMELHSTQRAGRPVISLSGRASTFRESSPTIDRDDDYSLGVSLSLPLYTGGTQSSQLRGANNQFQAAKYARNDSNSRIENRVRNFWHSWQSSKAIIEARQERLTAAQTVLTGMLKGQNAGLYSLLEVLDANDELVNAKIGLNQAEEESEIYALVLLLYASEDLSNFLKETPSLMPGHAAQNISPVPPKKPTRPSLSNKWSNLPKKTPKITNQISAKHCQVKNGDEDGPAPVCFGSRHSLETQK